MMKSKSFYSLVSTLNQLSYGVRISACVTFSFFNYKLLCLLFKLGFLRFVRVLLKRGLRNSIEFGIQSPIHGRKLIIKVISPLLIKNSSKNFFVNGITSYNKLKCFYNSEIVIVSTTRGLMVARDAVLNKLGGHVVLVIY